MYINPALNVQSMIDNDPALFFKNKSYEYKYQKVKPPTSEMAQLLVNNKQQG
jgi:hypothetical protein